LQPLLVIVSHVAINQQLTSACEILIKNLALSLSGLQGGDYSKICSAAVFLLYGIWCYGMLFIVLGKAYPLA
jgi:hypothetical protein